MGQGRTDKVRDPVIHGNSQRFETLGYISRLVRSRDDPRGGDGKEIASAPEVSGPGAVGD